MTYRLDIFVKIKTGFNIFEVKTSFNLVQSLNHQYTLLKKNQIFFIPIILLIKALLFLEQVRHYDVTLPFYLISIINSHIVLQNMV